MKVKIEDLKKIITLADVDKLEEVDIKIDSTVYRDGSSEKIVFDFGNGLSFTRMRSY